MDRPRLAFFQWSWLALLSTLVPVAPAGARDLDLGLPGLELRLDGTARYNVGLRIDPIDGKIAANPIFTGGEQSVEQWGLTTNRLDLLLELDAVYRDRVGLRVSGAGWYDDAYRDRAVAGNPPSYLGGELHGYTLDRYRGPFGELLDAFLFARLDLGGIPVALKAGRHTIYWGESLMQAGAIQGISYSQMPLDMAKAAATPGIEAKELFRPLASISAQAQVTPDVSVAAQLFLEWKSYLYSEGGTFLGGPDWGYYGPDGISPPGPSPTFLKNAGVSWPREIGDFGVAARWAPAWLDGTLGLYYRRFTDKAAAVLLTANPGGLGPMSPTYPSPFEYHQYYGEDVDLVGLSLAKSLLGASVGAEVSWRHDQPLLAQPLGFAVAPAAPLQPILFPHGPPTLVGNSLQARGDTLHALLNAVGVVKGGSAFSTASWAVEVTYVRWLAVRENEDMFFAVGHGVCRSDPALTGAGFAKGPKDGCATRDSVGLGAGFTPTWLRAFSRVDVLLPLSATWTIGGNAPVTFGGNEGSGSWSAGVAADVAGRVRFDLRYADYFGRTKESATALTSANGIFGILEARGNVAFTAKATF